MRFWALKQAIIGTAIVAAGWAAVFIYPDFWYWELAGVVISGCGLVAFLRRHSLKRDWPLLLHALVFIASVFGFVFSLQAGIFSWIVLSVFVLVFAIHLLNLLRANPIREIGQLVNLVAAFTFLYSVYSLVLLFAVPDWQLLIISLVGIFILVFAWLPQEKDKRWQSFLYALLAGLIFSQIAWAITFWPTTVLVNAVIVLLFFYVISNIVISSLWEELDFKRIWQYIIIAGVLAAAVIATADWAVIS